MGYRVEFVPKAVDDLQRLDKTIAQRILGKLKWLSQCLDDLTPEILAGEFKGLYKLRVGSYRVIYTVNRDDRLLKVYLIGHRRDIYKRQKPG
jgi:mRNA interferase RelE/StbE